MREDWPLAQRVRELEAEQEKLTALEESLRECDLGDLIPKPPRQRRRFD
ncbi:MAG: hypothetical protein OXG19_01675 [Chloroflexi bacterium]|nr:hypothetical protein [Chloroflexota bacterium]